MSYKNWLNSLEAAEKSSIMNGSMRKVFYKFPDGRCMAEEYSLDTGVVIRRAWRKRKQLMGEPEWEFELGETPRQINVPTGLNNPNDDDTPSGFTVRESDSTPMLSKRITKRNIEWRIRNLPYPYDVYQISADKDKHAIVVRTTNKKFYKVIPVEELDRCCLLPEQANLSSNHQYNTLIITYRKPDLVCEMEANVLMMLKDVPTETAMEEFMQGLLAK